MCVHRGIGFEPSPSYDPQRNGASERLVHEHWMCARIMLFAVNFENIMWGRAIIHANLLRNHLPASRIKGKIPTQSWSPETRVWYRGFLEFEFPGFAFIYGIEATPRKNFLPRSVLSYFVGNESDTMLNKVFIPQTKTFMNSRRSVFRKYEGLSLTGFEALLSGIVR